LSELIISNQNNHYFYVGIIFAVIIFLAYTPIIFLDQTVMINTPILPEYLEYQNKDTLFGITVDYSQASTYPNIKLYSKIISEGELPLWNPYVATGYPLGADTTHHIFSPISLGFILPSEYWDFPVLVVLWIAGFSMYIFLRNLGLNFVSSISGGIFYMLSGAFTWYIVGPNPFVIMVTPLILFSIDKIFRNKNPKYIILLSFTFGFSVLGGHLQSLFLQFLVIILYSLYRCIQIFFVSQSKLQYFSFKQGFIISSKSILKVSLGLIGGFGITSFYILYVLEFFQHGILDNSLTYGSVQWNPLTLVTIAIPNILGNITRTWTTNVEWATYFGYSGAIALFFAIVSIFYIKKKKFVERFTPIFFLFLSVLVLLRILNVPVFSEITTLPVFELISLAAYSGAIITLGFTIAAAFGINYISTEKISTKNCLIGFSVGITLIGILLIPVILEFLSQENLSNFISSSDIQNYILLQVAQAVFFFIIVLIISIISRRKTQIIFILPVIVILELLLYLPFGLHPISVAYKFGLIAISMIFLVLFSNFFQITTVNRKKIFCVIIISLLVGVSAGSVVISEKSLYGMPTRYDVFVDNEITEFLKNNLENQRIFSFDSALRTDYNAAFDISSLGIFSSFSVNDYYTFTKKFLDKEVTPMGLGAHPWSNNYGPEKSMVKFFENKKYFDFLGVKYIITQGYNFNSVSYGISGISGNHIILNSNEEKFFQTFVSPTSSIDSLGIFIFGVNFEDTDQLILSIDSVPYSEENHRTSQLSKIKNSVTNEFQISPPIMNSLEKSLKFSLNYPEASDEKYVVLYFDIKSDNSEQNVKFFLNGEENKNEFIPFVITPVEQDFPIPFNFHDIFINENLDAFPRAYLVHDFVTVPINTAQDYLVKNNDFDLRNSVILESSLSEFKSNNFKSISYNSDSLEFIEFNENNISLKTFSENDSILILTDVFYPGWNVSIDGETSEILRANGLVRAVMIPEGSHIIEFNYIPSSFWFGLLISISTVILLFIVYLYSRKTYPKIKS